MATSNLKDWNGVTHRRIPSGLPSAFSSRGYGFGISVACGKVYDDRRRDVDFDASSDIDCMACIVAGLT